MLDESHQRWFLADRRTGEKTGRAFPPLDGPEQTRWSAVVWAGQPGSGGDGYRSGQVIQMSKIRLDRLSVPGFYVDSEWRIYFRVREFLLSRGLPDKARVRSAITQGVLEIADRRRIWLVYE